MSLSKQFPVRLSEEQLEFLRGEAASGKGKSAADVVRRLIDEARERVRAEHVIACRNCGKDFDPRDLTQVIYHETHEPVEYTGIYGVAVPP